eukprot:SM000088S23778  [mRNA]  locus=s88:467286:469266:- [translate_table: standard]
MSSCGLVGFQRRKPGHAPPPPPPPPRRRSSASPASSTPSSPSCASQTLACQGHGCGHAPKGSPWPRPGAGRSGAAHLQPPRLASAAARSSPLLASPPELTAAHQHSRGSGGRAAHAGPPGAGPRRGSGQAQSECRGRSGASEALKRARDRLPVQDAALREDAEQEARELAWQEAGLFNVDEEEHASRLQAAVNLELRFRGLVASSNILRNLSFVPSNHASLIAESKFLECLLEILEAHQTAYVAKSKNIYLKFTAASGPPSLKPELVSVRDAEDDELVTNAIEIIANIAYLVNLRPQLSEDAHSSSSLNDRLLECLKMMLEAEPRVWHVAAAEALSLLASNGNNEPVLPSLVSLVSFSCLTLPSSAKLDKANLLMLGLGWKGPILRETG